jgi:hypothetical protein
MNPLPFLSHRLFVAALSEEPGPRSKPDRKKPVVPLPETARAISLEPVDCARPLPAFPAPTLPPPATLNP